MNRSQIFIEKSVLKNTGKQTRRLLLIGFGGLLALLVFTGLNGISALSKIQSRNETIRQDYVNRQQKLEELRNDLYVSGTYVRDLLLEPDPSRADVHRKDLDATTADIQALIAGYRKILRVEEQQPFEDFANGVSAYFDSLQPALNWDTAQRRQFGYAYMRDSLLPGRTLVVHLADQISRFNQHQMEMGNQQVSVLFSTFRRSLVTLLVLTLASGLVLAITSVSRILRLEHLSVERLNEVLQAKKALQELSARLVEVQETERRSLSRELHDEVGQVMSALLLGVSNVSASISPQTIEQAKVELQEIKRVAEKTVAVIRDMSLLLRPSMLDDLGLIPALEWQAREISRNNKVRVEVTVDPESMADQDLPDEQKTCVYRVVQEALRNVIRHAKARTVQIRMTQNAKSLCLLIKDDGQGFLPERHKGVGLLGMEERVKHLNGTFRIDSNLGSGTTIHIELPRDSI